MAPAKDSTMQSHIKHINNVQFNFFSFVLLFVLPLSICIPQWNLFSHLYSIIIFYFVISSSSHIFMQIEINVSIIIYY